MPEEPALKPVVRVGSSRRDLRAFPDPVRVHMGYAIYVAQQGGKHRDAKVLRGFGGAGWWKWSKIFAAIRSVRCTRSGSPVRFTCCTRSRRNQRQGTRRRDER